MHGTPTPTPTGDLWVTVDFTGLLVAIGVPTILVVTLVVMSYLWKWYSW